MHSVRHTLLQFSEIFCNCLSFLFCQEKLAGQVIYESQAARVVSYIFQNLFLLRDEYIYQESVTK